VTKLERFIKANDLRPAQIARETGISRQYLLRVRMGRMDPTRLTMVRIAGGCARILRRDVPVRKLFDLTVRWR